MKPTQHFVAATEIMRSLVFKVLGVAYLCLVRPAAEMQ